MPKELRRLPSQDDKGQTLLLRLESEGGLRLGHFRYPAECERGLHLCMVCGSKEHGASTCPANKKAEGLAQASVADDVHRQRRSPQPCSIDLRPTSASQTEAVGTNSPASESCEPCVPETHAAVPAAGTSSAGRTPIFVEVFCGLARLSKAARELGFKAAPVDHICNTSSIKVMKLDLCSKEGRSLLKGLLENPDVYWVHWAPPCGTFSRKHLRLKPCFPVWEGCSLPVPVYPSTAVRGHRRVHPQRAYCVASGG